MPRTSPISVSFCEDDGEVETRPEIFPDSHDFNIVNNTTSSSSKSQNGESSSKSQSGNHSSQSDETALLNPSKKFRHLSDTSTKSPPSPLPRIMPQALMSPDNPSPGDTSPSTKVSTETPPKPATPCRSPSKSPVSLSPSSVEAIQPAIGTPRRGLPVETLDSISRLLYPHPSSAPASPVCASPPYSVSPSPIFALLSTSYPSCSSPISALSKPICASPSHSYTSQNHSYASQNHSYTSYTSPGHSITSPARSCTAPPSPLPSPICASINPIGVSPSHSYTSPSHSYTSQNHSYASQNHSYTSYTSPAHSYTSQSPSPSWKEKAGEGMEAKEAMKALVDSKGKIDGVEVLGDKKVNCTVSCAVRKSFVVPFLQNKK